MPAWLEVIIWVAAGITAALVIWRSVVLPFTHAVAMFEEQLPVVTALTESMAEVPEWSAILKEIVVQVRSDSGSSLLDIVKGLRETATESQTAAAVLRVNVETVRRLAEQDREQLARLLDALMRVNVKVDNAAMGAANIATDLADSQARADAFEVGTQPGEASDAAARGPTEEP